MNDSLILFSQNDIQQYCNTRDGEMKMGQTLDIVPDDNWQDYLKITTARFVLLGMPEDIGVRANAGIGGASNAWSSFLAAFLNIQDNTFLSGREFLLLGTVKVQNEMEHFGPDIPKTRLQEGVAALDNKLFPIIQAIVAAEKIPILIGGGHNNAFPLLKGASLAKGRSMNAINMDAHADFRALEGRHSGNGFSYAYHQDFLAKYSVFGLHEAYNNASMVQQFEENPDLKASWFEDMKLRNPMSFQDQLERSLAHVNEAPFGVELDLDAIQDTLSSAQTPLGFSRVEAWQYLFACGKEPYATYLHLTEAVAVRADHIAFPLIGKLLSYLVQSFTKAKLESRA